ncbi:hypothetical protein ANCDUO_14154, partial [Ancylostoma duodenale]
MDVTLPLSFPDEDEADPTFLPSSERLRLETRLQALKALQSSYSLTGRFWELYKNQYLTAQREQYRRNIDNKRGSTREVREGEVVLLTDPFQKRNHWKLARISKLIPSSDGAAREVEVYCNKKTLRRPINQLIPLELEGTNNETERSNMSKDQKIEPHPATNRYDLRPRTKAASSAKRQQQGQSSVACFTTSRSMTWPVSVYLKMALCLAAMIVASGEQPRTSIAQGIHDFVQVDYAIECRERGLYHHAPQSHKYELCVNNYCITEKTAPVHKLLNLPPEEMLHDFEAHWKLRTGNSYTAVETSCPAQPFCSSIACTLFAANILNPE